MNSTAQIIGYVVMTAGGALLSGVLIWGALKLLWYNIRTAGILGDVVKMKAMKKRGEWIDPRVTSKKSSAHPKDSPHD